MVSKLLLPAAVVAVVLLSCSGSRREGTATRDLLRQAQAAYGGQAYAVCARLYDEAGRGSAGLGMSDAYDAACCQALAGQREAAFASLERAVEKGFQDVAHLQRDTDLSALHGEPRWEKLVAAVTRRAGAFLEGANPELLRLFTEDQAERVGKDSTTINWAEVAPRDAARRAQVQAIVDGGGARTSADYFHAAMVFQHGTEVSDFQTSHRWRSRRWSSTPPTARPAGWRPRHGTAS